MIRNLRRKFILTNMLLVSLVLVIVFAVLVGSNYQKLSFQTEASLRSALMWRDDNPPPRLEIGVPEPDRERRGDGPHNFFIPVFTVTLDETGAVADYNGGNNVEISDETVDQLVAAVQDQDDSGTVPGMSLRYLRETDSNGVRRIAFADLSWQWDTLRTLVLTSLLVGAAALVCFFLVSLLLSRLALRPVEAAWEQQRRFVADASHELKTPLTVILTNSGILLSHKEDTVGKQAKWVEYIREEAQRMRILVEDLLFLAKNDSARENAAKPANADLSALSWSALLPFESVAFEAGVELESDIAPGLTVLGQADQLRRLVAILLDNAVKYAGSGGKVAVRLERGEKNTVRLTVRNTGPAIPAEHMEHLFERFYRADDSRARALGGYGLGLAIAKSVVDGHKGTITVSSSEGQGTTFTVKLPAFQG
ncbi:MAG: two-component sensor histidine kinase [Clostridia bacterium]|nr:two-component sensor histidine kinase [Clostridia bacterium]